MDVWAAPGARLCQSLAKQTWTRNISCWCKCSTDRNDTVQVRDIEQKVLLLWGKQDKILDPKYVLEFERDLKRVQTRLIDDCGHVAHLEQSERCADEILKFSNAKALSAV